MSLAWGACPAVPDDALEAMQVLSGCLPAPWSEALVARREGRPGSEAELCKKGRKLFDDVASLEKVAKKCGGEEWPLERVSGPRALVLAWALREPLEQAGVADPERAAQAVAGIHGPPPTYGGFLRQVGEVPIAAHGAPVGEHAMLIRGAEQVWEAPEPGAHELIALPSPPWTEDTPLLALPFVAAPTVTAPLRIDGVTVSYGAAGSQVTYGTPEEAVDAARHWLDWSQEFGREEQPDRLWIRATEGTTAQVARLLEATLTEHGEPRFGEVVVAPEGHLSAWSATVDAQGVQ